MLLPGKPTKPESQALKDHNRDGIAANNDKKQSRINHQKQGDRLSKEAGLFMASQII
jgi:hypothetical protein